jgi:hypothetical protein
MQAFDWISGSENTEDRFRKNKDPEDRPIFIR